jgi:hypothetical protein
VQRQGPRERGAASMIAGIIIVVVLYALFHAHHVRRNYRHHRLSLTASMYGPFGVRISKRFRF